MSEALIPFCTTEKQRELVRAVGEHGNPTAAAKVLGMDDSYCRKAYRLVKARATEAGVGTHFAGPQLPEGLTTKKTSTMYGADGEVKLQWHIADKEAEDIAAAMQAASDAFKEDLPKARKVTAPEGLNSDLLNQYTITDYHLGMKAWANECGSDWDPDIAEDLLNKWFASAVEMAPTAATGILANIADFMHWDGVDAVTPASGHLLDADTRFQRLIKVAIRLLRNVIRMMLTKHKSVHVIIAEGNHDPASSMWLREWLTVFYENEPRITVDDSAIPYYCYEHGDTALFYHHGHKRKVANVDSVFAAMFREVFGRTKHAYAHMGHLHSIDVKETNLMLVEQHRTLASPDAYAARGGWISGRDAKVITYSKRFGEVSRITISPEMLQ